MNATLFFIIIAILHIPYYFGLYKIFEKWGYTGWHALVPFYNRYLWIKKLKKPTWWVPISYVPVLGFFFIVPMLVEIARGYKRYGLLDHIAIAAFPFAMLPFLGLSEKEKWHGVGGVAEGKKPPKKSKAREWADAIIFAFFAATFIRMLFFEAYTIPTPSMEGSLLVGDYLFVSKFHYGPRVPITPLAFPFAHHTMPVTNTKAYSELVKLPYMRLPGLQDIKRNDMVVFNLPAGDTLTAEFDSRKIYYDMVRQLGRDVVWNNFEIKTRPVDKRENYIKRCVAIAGDSMELKSSVLHINGEVGYQPNKLQFLHIVACNNSSFNLYEKYNKTLDLTISNFDTLNGIPRSAIGMYITEEVATALKQDPTITEVSKYAFSDDYADPNVYPHKPGTFKWNVDNYGPIWIPAKGESIKLTPNNLALYERCIVNYEGNTLRVDGDQVYINDEAVDEYTFQYDYYFMMGDNRHASQDSRMWGFVPEDHVVGKAWFIFMSMPEGKSGIRFDRILNFAHNKWAPE